MFENLNSFNVFAPTALDVIMNLLVALSCSFIITLIYRWTYKGPGFSDSFINSIVFLSLITALIIMVIGNNLARAFGLVGAMSIIRFRTAIKDTLDIVYIFFGLTIGMGSGVGYHKLVFTGTAVIGLVLVLFAKTKWFEIKRTQYLLDFQFHGTTAESILFEKVLGQFCKDFRIINVRTLSDNKTMHYSYYFALKNQNQAGSFIDSLRQTNGVTQVHIFFDQDPI